MRLLLVRHGATEWSIAGRHTGSTDLPLTPLGSEQAIDVRRRVVALVGDIAASSSYSSPLQRARVTAELIMGPGACVVDDRLREFDYGDYEGLTTAEIRDRAPGWTVWNGCPGGETVDDVVVRVDSFLAEVRATRAPVVVLFAHGHLLRILGARDIGQPGDFGKRLSLDTASVSEVDDLRDGSTITLWNETAHD